MMNTTLRASRDAFILSAIALFGMFVMMLFVDDGVQAIATMSGLPLGQASASSLTMAGALDFLVPLFYGAGFILLVCGLSSDERSTSIVTATVLLVVVGTSLDLIENGMIITSPEVAHNGIHLTLAKFGTLSIAAFLISTLLTPDTLTTKIAIVLFRYVSPISIALNIVGINGDLTPWLFVPSLMGTFLFSAWLANSEAGYRA